MKKLVVFTGAGISAESGLRTFRDSNGLWEEYRIEDVATPEAWRRNRALVLDFYNQRRKQVLAASPNRAHIILAELQVFFDVQIITQNIDDLHERAGSQKVLHLHGEILKSRSSLNPGLIYDIKGPEIREGDKCELGSQLRPHIVWFGEEVHALIPAAKLVSAADLFIVIGTSLQVYPAAGLVYEVPASAEKFLIDPHAEVSVPGFTVFRTTAGNGMLELKNKLLNGVIHNAGNS